MKIDDIEEKYYITRKWKDINFEIIDQNIIMSNNYMDMLTSDDINKVTNCLINTIQQEIDIQAPLIKSKVIKPKDKLSKETKLLIKSKNNLYKQLKNNDYDNNIIIDKKREFKNIERQCRKSIEKDRKTNINKNISENINNPSKLWKSAKDQLYGKKQSQPDRIIENGRFINGSKNVSNSFNRFFISKVKKLADNIPDSNIDPMHFFRKYITKMENSFSFKTISMSTLKQIISKINNTKSSDYHGLSMTMIKKLKISVYPILLNIVNLAFINSIFPDNLKISKIITVPKANDFLNLNNYRGVHILSPISKVIEKVMAEQIILYLNTKNLLNQNHQGGIKNRGTTKAIINIDMKINQILEKGKTAAVIALDQSACYDIISHKILQNKLKHIGFDQQSLKLLDNFLSDRKQYVELNSVCSNLLVSGNRSVLQGSVMSTLLYNVFMLDLPLISHNIVHSSHYEQFVCDNPFQTTFVDDVFCVIEGETYDIWKIIQLYIDLMEQYYTSNKLCINVSKTQIMTVQKTTKLFMVT